MIYINSHSVLYNKVAKGDITMKRISEIVKPFSAIIFGVLLFLLYFNFLQRKEAALAVGIIATIFGAFYLAVGVLNIIAGAKLSPALRKVMDIVTISTYPLFVFIYELILIINLHELMGPAGWTIGILTLAGSICFALVYAVVAFVKVSFFKKLSYLFAPVFVLVLLANLLFNPFGDAVSLGNLIVVQLVIDVLYISMLAVSFPKEEKASE